MAAMNHSSRKKAQKVKEVAAIRYSPDQNKAPEVVALGKGDVAEKILEAAEDAGVPIYHDPTLAHTLNMLDIGDEIPPELYEVVAEVLVFINSLDRDYGDRSERRREK